MSNVAQNVRVGTTGALSFGPLGTTLPTDAKAALNAALKDVGYLGPDGVTQAIESDVTDIKAWQNGDTVRKVQTSHDLTFQFVMLETNALSLKIYYADETATATAVKITGKQSPHNVMVIDVLDDKHTIRIVLPDAQVTERGEVVYQNEEATGYDVTVTAYPDANGVKAYIYLATDTLPAGGGA